jgi:sugar lactone lactonase YvrE
MAGFTPAWPMAGSWCARGRTAGSEFADTGGRPLGLAFAPDGALFVADALRGLLRHNAGGGFEVWMADESEGGVLVFTDDLTVLEDGSIILTDASRRWGYGEYMNSFIEGEQTGVVYRITAPGDYEALAEGFSFINGVDHDPETGLVYLNETWAGRIWVLDPDTRGGRGAGRGLARLSRQSGV